MKSYLVSREMKINTTMKSSTYPPKCLKLRFIMPSFSGDVEQLNLLSNCENESSLSTRIHHPHDLCPSNFYRYINTQESDNVQKVTRKNICSCIIYNSSKLKQLKCLTIRYVNCGIFVQL